MLKGTRDKKARLMPSGGRVQYTEELYHTLTSPEFVEACLTTVVICGPPVTKQFVAEDVKATSDNFKDRNDWLEAVEKCCLERFKMSYGDVGDFITVLEIWWEEQEGAHDTDDALANVVVNRCMGG